MASSRRNRKRKISSSSQSSPSKKQKIAQFSPSHRHFLHSESSKHLKTHRGLLQDPLPYDIEFTTGQIVRIELTNWVTFDYTVIDAEPGLNLIVGPNGTGKSSVVCAIGIGLGGKPTSLGRGSKLKDFIKREKKCAKIRIELHNEGKENDVIERIITHQHSEWKFQRGSKQAKKVSSEQILKFIKEKRNIKVDNLCQFLAQDRVSEFARLTPKQLLIETEKAIEDDQLYKWHKFLIDEGNKASTTMKDIENLKDALHQNQAEIDTLTKTIEQFEQQKKMKKQIKQLSALQMWKEVENSVHQWKKSKKQTATYKKKYDKKKSDVGPLNAKMSEFSTKSTQVSRKCRQSIQALRAAQNRKQTASNKLKNCGQTIASLEDNIQSVNQESKDRAKRIKKMEHELQALQCQADDFDQNEINEAKQKRSDIMKGGLRTVRNKREEVENKLRSLRHVQNKEEQNKQRIEHQLQQWTNIQSRKDSHIFDHKHRKDKQLKMWIDTHRHEFDGEVYGPIVNEMTVTDDLLASFLNMKIAPGTLYGYVCTNKRDWTRVLHETKKLGLRITIYNMSDDGNNNNNHNLSQSQSQYSQSSQHHIRRPVDVQTLQQYGISGYLDQAYEAADIIKKCLNDNVNLHQQAYATQDVDARSLDHVMLTRKGQSGVLKTLITPDTMISCKASRYSEQVLRSTKTWRPHRTPILIKTPDFTHEIADHEELRKQCHAKLDNIHGENEKLQKEKKQIVACINKLNENKLAYERIIQSYANCIRKKTKKEKDLAALMEEDNDENPDKKREKLLKQIQKKNIERIMALEKVAVEMENEHNLMKQCNALQIAQRHFEEERKHINKIIKDIQSKHASLKRAYIESRKLEQQLHNEMKSLRRRANKEYPQREYAEHWTEEDKKMNCSDIEDKINHLQGRINVLFIDQQRVQRYGRLKEKIVAQRKQLDEMQNEQNDKEKAIRDIESQWKPKLTEAIEKISRKFGEFFRQFNNAEGEIRLANHGNPEEELKYSEYCIDIHTKFRADEEFTRLTSTTQSGGEKSVSTMLYLLSLQQVTTVPFRVVDEINQGMDPMNERRVMQILNYECTPKGRNNKSLPQYFVVTPKLLPDLQYSPCSSVFIIYNGPFQMPHQDWKMNKFVESQKQLSPPRDRNNNNNQAMDEDEESENEDD